MHLIKAAATPTFNDIPGLSVCGLAAPSRGARETCVWRITIAPHTSGTPHAVSREEIFVALAGQGRVEIDGEDLPVAVGDTLIVPAGRSFSLSNPGDEPFTALTVLPVEGRAVLPGGQAFCPPWAV
jgi:quercetin dioxygenase-like cupin family protein